MKGIRLDEPLGRPTNPISRIAMLSFVVIGRRKAGPAVHKPVRIHQVILPRRSDDVAFLYDLFEKRWLGRSCSRFQIVFIGQHFGQVGACQRRWSDSV